MHILGLFIMVALIFAGLYKHDILLFVDPASFMIVVFVTQGALLFSFGKGLGKAFIVFFRRTVDRNDLILAAAICDRGQSFAAASGVMGTIIGTIMIFFNLDHPDAIGPGFAVAVLTYLYGFGLAYCLLLPMTVSLRRRIAEEKV